MKYLIFLLIIPVSVLLSLHLQADVEHLTTVLFANLEGDPRIKNTTLQESKVFIDKQVANYMALIKKTHGLNDHSLTRRSLPIDESTTLTKDDLGIYVLDDILPLYGMNLQFPKDIQLFEHVIEGKRSWYAAVLEGKSFDNDLVVYEYKDENFSVVDRVSVTNGVKLSLIPLLENICIVVAENSSDSKNIREKKQIFYFLPETRRIKGIQYYGTEYATDVAIWKEHKNIFMVVAISMKDNKNYEVDVPIYRWLGKHFGVIDSIKTYGVRKITPFIIGNSHFLAVANFQNNFGKTNIYSEIFKYNRHVNKFESYQKILTQAAVDVKYFYFEGLHVKEHFLIFANLFEEDNKGNRDYEIDSIVYKYVEGYFIPFQSIKLNGASEWLPVMGFKGEFALFAACQYDGIKIFQYDGWKLTESKVQYTDETFSKGVLSMRAYAFKNKTLIVLANKNHRGNITNIFELKFGHKKMLNEFYEDNLLWCQKSLEKHKIFKRSIDTNEEKLKQYESEVADLEKQLRLALNSTEDNLLEGDLNIDRLNLENTDTVLDSASSTFINNENTSNLFSAVININKGFTVENVFELDDATVPEIFPEHVNNQVASSIVYTNKEGSLGELIVNGEVIFQKGLVVDGKINDVNFTKENVLLRQGNQSLGSLDLNILAAELLDADFINDIDMSQIDSINTQPVVVEKIDTLNVKTARIKGFINNVDISNLNKHALKSFGTQTITGKYKFDTLYVDNFNTNILSGKNLTEELVLIDEGEYQLAAAEFNTFSTETVIVSESLNHIFVIDGDLDILMTNSSQVQHITGTKEFDEVELMNPIKLGGRIHNPKIDQMNPVQITNEEIELIGDYTIKGEFQVEQFLQVSDIQSGLGSVQNLQNIGLKLTDAEVPCHLNFTQQLNVLHILADAINDVLVDSLVVMGTDEEQVITGCKTFSDDVFITDRTDLGYVNSIHLPTLEANVLKITGDQTMTGNHHFENVVANRVFNVKTTFGDRAWENVITMRSDQVIPGTTVITGTLQLDELETDRLAVFPDSLVNGFNFTFMIEDSVFRNDSLAISGPTKFKNIIVENLYADNLDLAVVPRVINESKSVFQFDHDIELPQGISTEEIYFTDHLNNLHSKDFEDHWLSNTDDEVFRSDQSFNRIIIYAHLSIGSGFLNHVNITSVSEDSVKIDEDYHFSTVTFTRGLASTYGVTLDGQFESLDVNDIVLSHTMEPQLIVHEIIFKSNVTVDGEVVFKGLISGFNLTEFCEFSFRESIWVRDLHINGNAYFVKGPEINTINEMPIKHLMETVWFSTRDCIVAAQMEFENIMFQEDVIVHGFVDDIKIQLIAQTYLSKSKNQNVSAVYNFDDTVLFGNGIYAPRASVRGNVGEINLGEFISTALLNNYNQVFESTVYLEDCEILELSGEYLVNDFNLQYDVMRYDKHNVVSGRKTVADVKSHTLNIDKYVVIQNVNLVPWIHDSVLKSDTFHLVGRVILLGNTTFSNGISFRNGMGMKFDLDTIMVKSKPQTIRARKYFDGNENQTVNFRNLNVKLINGINISNLMQHQAYKNQDVIFQSPIYFNGSITTPNMHAEKLYQGVNVSDLVNNITEFSTTHNYTENFENLLETASEVKSSLQEHAYFIDYYKIKQKYHNVDFVIPVILSNDRNQYLACIRKGSKNYTITFDVWDSDAEMFHRAAGIAQILAPTNLRYIKEIKFRGAKHWYIEHEKTTIREIYVKFEGSLFEITRSGFKQIMPAIVHNGTKFVSSIDLPFLNKCIFLLFTSNALVYCQSFDSSVYWNPYQEIETFNSVEGTVTNVNNVTYIFILNSGTLDMTSSVDVWKFDLGSKVFVKEQSIYMQYPSSISTIFYKGYNFFAVASGYARRARYAGMITINKYDPEQEQYVKWQEIPLNVPIQVLFAELPTQELVLYVSTNNPTQPFIVYQYEGISKFTQKLVAKNIPPSSCVKSFNTLDMKHFILLQNGNETSVIEAVFKGQQSG